MALNKVTSTLLGYPDWHGTSLADFNNWINIVKKQTKTETLIFRGQRKNWPLLPSISRTGIASQLLENERKLFEKFKKAGEPCLHLVPDNDWDWLVVAQHHGLPTRLLDWSYDPIIALWFAIEQSRKEDSAPEIWALQPLKEDFVDQLNESKPFMGTRTKIFETNFSIPRIRAQKGCFTLFKHSEKFSKGFVPLEKNANLRKRIMRIRIAKYACENISYKLAELDVSKDSIYPDINRVAKKVKNEVLGNA